MPTPFATSSNTTAVLNEGRLVVQDSLGNDLIILGQLETDVYGLELRDPQGNVRLRLGEITDGVYDLASYDPANSGDTMRLSALAFGAKGASTHATVTVESIVTWEDLGGPNVEVSIGPSGRAFAFGSATAANGNVGVAWGGYIGVSVDSDTPSNLNNCSVTNPAAGSLNIPLAGGRLIEGLTQGTHQFSLWYGAFTSQDVDFSDRSLLVFPF